MKRPAIAPVLAFALSLVISTLGARADVPSDVKTVLMDKLLGRAEVGIEVVRLGSSAQSSTVIFKHESQLPLIPASNLKVITTSAALDALGPDFRFRTLL